MSVPRLWVYPVADTLPVVFGGGRNPVPVITKTNLVGRLKLTKGILNCGELRVGCDAGVKGCGNILRRAVNALHVLEQADDLRDRLR